MVRQVMNSSNFILNNKQFPQASTSFYFLVILRSPRTYSQNITFTFITSDCHFQHKVSCHTKSYVSVLLTLFQSPISHQFNQQAGEAQFLTANKFLHVHSNFKLQNNKPSMYSFHVLYILFHNIFCMRKPQNENSKSQGEKKIIKRK